MNQTFNSDLDDLIEKGWKNYRVLSQAPPQLEPLCDAVLSMVGLLRLTHDAIRENQLSATDQWVVNGQKEASNLILSQLEAALASLRSHQLTVEAVASLKDKFAAQSNQLSSFLKILQGYSKQKISAALSKISDIQSVSKNWEALQLELKKFSIPEELIAENFFYIDQWLKENDPGNGQVVAPVPEPEAEAVRGVEAVRIDEEHEELPGYTPGAKRGTIEEKVQSLEQTTMIMNHSDPGPSMATSSKPPPAYTFEEGHDEDLDQDFAKYIKEAVDNEASRRALERVRQPGNGPQPYYWLPKNIQSQYQGRQDIITILEPNSFTTMAYETAPKCIEEIDRLTTLLRVSSEHKNLSRNDGVVNEALGSLYSMSKAISKFMLLQNQHKSSETFSDMDALDFEYSTSYDLDSHQEFPVKEFEFCQRSYYRLLTYIMGMLEVFSYVFQGRTYITRSRQELEWLWKDKKMNTRTAWIEKQLAGWEDVESAALFCREWRSLRPFIREKALKALDNWQQSERILSGSEVDDNIEITVISASGLPKSTFGRPSAVAKLVLYIAGQTGGQMRVVEQKTDVAPKSQEPVWNKTFQFTLRKKSKWKNLDVDIFDRVAGMENHIGRVRLGFSFVPGVEANFAGRSLIYGYDEEVEYRLSQPVGKGKEKEPPMVKLRLKWVGRQVKVEEAELPPAPPGKLFKPGFTGIPLSQEERDELKYQASALTQPRSSSTSRTSAGIEVAGHLVDTATAAASLATSSSSQGASSLSFNFN